MAKAVEEDWRVLTSLFPEGWKEQAKLTGAIERQRGVKDPDTLLRLFLLHVAKGYSLRETAVRAKESGLATISDVGVLKRLRRSEDWLHWLCTRLVAENGVQLPSAEEPRSVRIVDGTIVRELGKTGSQWRILYSIRLPELRCDYFDLTATTGVGTGESLGRLPVAKSDLILADAGYCSAAGIRSVARRGGAVVVRVNPQNFSVQDQRGRDFDMLSHFQKLHTAGAIGDWKVNLGDIPGRICTLRKSEASIQQSHRRIERRASKKQVETKPETWEYAKYVAVFTTDLSPTPATILEWYRARWQIEITFKRLKSLAQLGHLPKSDAQSSRAWLYGKLFVALLTQKLVRTGRDISPWGYLLTSHTAAQ
jgi:hypothetical protein